MPFLFLFTATFVGQYKLPSMVDAVMLTQSHTENNKVFNTRSFDYKFRFLCCSFCGFFFWSRFHFFFGLVFWSQYHNYLFLNSHPT